MGERFLTFHTFSDVDIANDFAETLRGKGIAFVLEQTPQMLDSVIIGTSSLPDIAIKLLPEDFNKGHRCLEEYYRPSVNAVEKDYYLFSFTDKELFDLLRKPDEWGYLDFQLARKILNDRGFPVDDTSLEALREERIKFLARPERSGSFLFFVAYFFILCGLLYVISPLFNFFDYTFCSVLVSFFIGRHIGRTRKVLPDGQRVFYYREKDRKQGKKIANIGLVVFLCAVLKYLLYMMAVVSE